MGGYGHQNGYNPNGYGGGKGNDGYNNNNRKRKFNGENLGGKKFKGSYGRQNGNIERMAELVSDFNKREKTVNVFVGWWSRVRENF